MDPSCRKMLRVGIEDAAQAERMVTILMGDKVDPGGSSLPSTQTLTASIRLTQTTGAGNKHGKKNQAPPSRGKR